MSHRNQKQSTLLTADNARCYLGPPGQRKRNNRLQPSRKGPLTWGRRNIQKTSSKRFGAPHHKIKKLGSGTPIKNKRPPKQETPIDWGGNRTTETLPKERKKGGSHSAERNSTSTAIPAKTAQSPTPFNSTQPKRDRKREKRKRGGPPKTFL